MLYKSLFLLNIETSSDLTITHTVIIKYFFLTDCLFVCLFLFTEVLAVILSDLVFFLQENNQKYTFFSQDNKVGNTTFLISSQILQF